jgi:hypothetical protein
MLFSTWRAFWPRPDHAHELEAIISELEGIIRLNMVEHYGPVTLFDRAVNWQRRALIIRSRRTPDTITT